MKYLITLLILVTVACGPKSPSVSEAGPQKIPITKKKYCNDTLIQTLGMVLLVDAFGGITPMLDGTYQFTNPDCSYTVSHGMISGG